MIFNGDVRNRDKMAAHHAWRILVVLGSAGIFLAVAALTAVIAIPDIDGPFVKGGDALLGVTDLPTKLVPSTWTYVTLWAVTYVYTFLWVVYSLSTLCRRSSPSAYLYYKPDYLSVWMYVFFTLANIAGPVWFYLTDLGMVWEALVVRGVELALLGVALLVALFALSKEAPRLRALGKGGEIVWCVALVHNGLAMHVTWIYYVTVTQLCAVMTYVLQVDADVSCHVCLSIVAVEIVGVFVADLVMFKQRKHLYTPYIVSLTTLAGVLTNYYVLDDPITIYVFVLLFASVFALVFKFGWVIAKSRRGGGKRPPAVQEKKEPRGGVTAGVKVCRPQVAVPTITGCAVPANTCTTIMQPRAAVLQPAQPQATVLQPAPCVVQRPVVTYSQPRITAAQQPVMVAAQQQHVMVAGQQQQQQQQPVMVAGQQQQQPVMVAGQQQQQPVMMVAAQQQQQQPVMVAGQQQPVMVAAQQQAATLQPPILTGAAGTVRVRQPPLVQESVTSGLYPSLSGVGETPPASFRQPDTHAQSRAVFLSPEARSQALYQQNLAAEKGGATATHPQMAPLTSASHPQMAPPTSSSHPQMAPPTFVCGLEPSASAAAAAAVPAPPSYSSVSTSPIDAVILNTGGTVTFSGVP